MNQFYHNPTHLYQTLIPLPSSSKLYISTFIISQMLYTRGSYEQARLPM